MLQKVSRKDVTKEELARDIASILEGFLGPSEIQDALEDKGYEIIGNTSLDVVADTLVLNINETEVQIRTII